MMNFNSIYSSSDSNKNIICEHYGCQGLSQLFNCKFSCLQYNSNNNYDHNYYLNYIVNMRIYS